LLAPDRPTRSFDWEELNNPLRLATMVRQ